MKKMLNSLILAAHMNMVSSVQRAREKLKEKDGSFFTEHALAIVITVVIAAIVIVAIVALFKDKIFPNLNSKVDTFFALS